MMISRKAAVWAILISGLFFTGLTRRSDETLVREQVTALYHQNLQEFGRRLLLLKNTDATDSAQLKQNFLQCRLAYKKTECLVAYTESNRVRAINGPNLVNDEFDGGASQEIQPHGLQVIEYLIYNEGPSARAQRDAETDLLLAETKALLARNSANTEAHDLHVIVWDALRLEIYRIEALGITGFDVPDSEHAIPEAAAALEGMWQFIALYKPLFPGPEGSIQFRQGRRQFREAVHYARNNSDFAGFDRLTFIREHLHPLSGWLLHSARMLGYMPAARVQPLRDEALHLFDKDIWNPEYFGTGASSARVELGKKLFNDTRLSAGNSRSCASCHDAGKAFADGLRKPLSIDGSHTLLRNTPSLWNAALQTKQFYDARVSRLEKQALDVIHNKEEMGGDPVQIIHILKSDSLYPALFREAGIPLISSLGMLEALRAYIGSLQSFNSRFDRYMRGQTEMLSPAEKNGFNLFAGRARCATCHFMPLFNGLVPPRYQQTESEILGIPADAAFPSVPDADEGRFLFSGRPVHRYAFKTPGIRNVEQTAPYMHNGVFGSLEEVLEFYNQGGGAGRGMDMPGQTLSAKPLQLSRQEMDDIIRFMKALSDTAGQ
ncbi:MAG: cytochrome C peroxidase [Bacteroidia bacterium]|nr:cytochrome C peroxidase [Bacteroidia bacterium]